MVGVTDFCLCALPAQIVDFVSFAHSAHGLPRLGHMGSGKRTVLRLRTQVLLLQVAVIFLALGLAFAVLAAVGDRRLSSEYGQRALAIAGTVAAMPEVRARVTEYAQGTLIPGQGLADELSDGPLQHIAAAVLERSDALFVVITDEHGLRLAHPTQERLGHPVSTDPSGALAGRDVVVEETGTLGGSVRAKVPVRQPGSSTVAGEVSVGVSTTAVRDRLFSDLRIAGCVVGVAFLFGIGGSVLLARRWRSLTLGLEPAELAELVREQAAVLHGIGEGVLAVDVEGRTTVVNDEAKRLLGLDEVTGQPDSDIGLTPRILGVLREKSAAPVLATVGDRVVVVTARQVTRAGRELGAVLTVRDRTDVESLTRQLDAVQSMSAVLRAQRHEFANRLHLLSGLVHGNRTQEAARLLDELLGTGPLGAALPDIETLGDPYLQAFVAAKTANAREAGVTLTLGDNTWVSGTLVHPVDVTTVLGNLIDNAIDAARTGADSQRRVEVGVVQDGSTLHISVADSGDGVAECVADDLFAEGISTKEHAAVPGGRGVGLALSRQIARGLGGDVWLATAAGAGPGLAGAEFSARMPSVMTETDGKDPG
ncbi:signal transduction histidine kinase regulating citrate/malate metabolism [Mycobacteroides abscessus subsp. bolletii]|nr:signal transduction histidine kinase regulating citrate/malate metabolism [Mycobacteroides abscessus subsp. bolletii]